MQIKRKTTVVIGASGGIGRVISLTLALEGSRLILVGRRREKLQVVKKAIMAKGGVAEVYAFDITKVSALRNFAKKVGRRYKKVDILVNAAGIGVYNKFEELEHEEWEKSLDINASAVYLTIKYLLPFLKKSEKAYVLSMGSGMGKIASARRSAYCASKFALRGLMLSLAKEYKDTDIHFILLTLGSVLTSFGPLSYEDKLKKQKSGKEYLIPSKLAHLIVEKIKNDTLKAETSIYPFDYYKASEKGKI